MDRMGRPGSQVYSNPAFAKLLGGESDTLSAQCLPFLDWSPESADALEAHLEAELSGELKPPGHPPLSAAFRGANGERIPVSITCDTIRDANGEVRWHVCLIHDERRPPQAAAPQDDGLETRVQKLETLLRRIAPQVAEGDAETGLLGNSSRVTHPESLELLSHREQQVLKQVLDGQRASIIAQRLRISPHTVRAHLKSIFRKLGVRSQAELLDKLHPTR
jgi:DNA-binding CsgD family transcriptional regulator